MALWRWALVPMGGGMLACTLIFPIADHSFYLDDDAGADATVDQGIAILDAPAEAPNSDSGSDSSSRCTALHGPTMVQVPQDYCVDSTEVTNAQYKEFVKDGDLQNQTGVCAWNKTNVRGFKPPGYLWYDGYAGIQDNNPVQGANFCDAKAYCAWAGKRLCGQIGGGPLTSGAALAGGDRHEANGQWYAACAHGSALQAYPYGDVYKTGACNTEKVSDSYGTVAVASFAQCEGGYSGLFDMTGNLMEWIDLCDVDGADPSLTKCVAQGGSWNFDQTAARCDFGTLFTRIEGNTPQIGFRCCKD